MLVNEVIYHNSIKLVEWSTLVDINQKNQWTIIESTNETVIRFAASFKLDDLSIYSNLVRNKFDEFIASKKQNPLQPFGSKDFPMNPGAPLGRAVPGLMHAHLTQDVSVFYTLHGKQPRYIDIYGVFRHGDIGIGNTANRKTQKKYANKFANQRFSTANA